MKTEKETTRLELCGLCFFGCILLGSGWIIQTVKSLVFDQPSERLEECQNDWPVVLASIFLITIGWTGTRYFKKKLEESDSEEIKRPK
jgi:hypothetical protein